MHAFEPPAGQQQAQAVSPAQGQDAGSTGAGQAIAGAAGQGVPNVINQQGVSQPPTLEALIANLDARVKALETAASAPKPPPAPSLQPSKCRGVIFRDSTGNESAATITGVRTTGVDLVVFRNDALPGLVHNQPQIDPSTQGGTGWFWPPRT
jgi:hypothetical protein